MCRLLIAVTLSIHLSLFAALAFAQSTGATLTGVVSDETGAPVAGVELTLAEFSRGVQRVATSDAHGAYVFAGVPAGTYVLTGGSGAFAPVRVEALALAEGERRALPIRLRLAPLVERVAVTGEGGYTARAITLGKQAHAIREIPQSVSVLTRQRIQDQNLTTVGEALEQIAGVDAYDSNGLGMPDFYARGADLAAQFDGVPASSGFKQTPGFDLVLYDRIEVLRGPAGLLQGVGSVGGVANLVRKRPQRNLATTASLIGGAWNNVHGDFDVTGALNASGRLLGRAVVAGAARDFFYDVADERRWTGYGIIEIDLTRQTLLGVSVAAQRGRQTPFTGLPASASGGWLSLPRSTFVGPSWVDTERAATETAVDLQHGFGNGWIVKSAARHRVWDTRQQESFTRTPVDPAVLRTTFRLQNLEFDNTGTGVDVNVAGPITLFGRRHEVLAGYNFDRWLREGGSALVQFADLDLLNPGLDRSALPPIVNRNGLKVAQGGLYGTARIKLRDSLTAIGGGRVSHYSTSSRAVAPAATPWVESLARTSAEFSPYAGVVWDAHRLFSLYASYADTFAPQAMVDFAGDVLDPVIGWQTEAGIKSEFAGGRLNATLAVFRIRNENSPVPDPDPSHVGCGAASSPCFVAGGLAQSAGWEVEIAGSPLSGWDITAGYTDNDTKILRDADPANINQPINSYRPRRMFKLWSTYQFGAASQGRLSGLRVGLGIQAYSRTFTMPAYVAGGAIGVTQEPYAVASAQVGYRFNERLDASLTLNNLTGRTYYTQINDARGFNYLGEPRNVMAALRIRF